MISKLSLYDFFCILIAGYLTLYPFVDCYYFEWRKDLLPLFLLSYLVGLVYHKIVEYFTSPLRNNKYMIEIGKSVAQKNFKENKHIDIPENSDCYDDAYYYLMRYNCLYVIPILEAQVALIKNMYPLLIIYTICLSANSSFLGINGSCCIVLATIFAILIFTLPFVWYRIQIKIYQFVWEGYYYIKDSIKNENVKV